MTHRHIKAFVNIVSIAPVLYLVGLGVSFLLYVLFPIPLFGASFAEAVLETGVVVIGLATGLVFWAQHISRQGAHRKKEIIYAPTCRDFMRGPYRYTRHPGALGLMLMFAGFVLVTNSLVLVIILGLFIILETFWFIPMEEKTYMDECPGVYAEYKTKVRMWL